jgi:1-acyl-sn-glycerol-3-phosphate acyltransferase
LRPDVPNVHRKDTVFYWLLKCVVLGPVLKLLFRPDVTGLSNVPRSGPVILACNHLSFSDSIFTPLMVRRRVTFVAKAEYFTGKGIKGWLMRQFFANTGTIPVDRSGGEAARAALDTAATRRSSPRGGVVPAGR